MTIVPVPGAKVLQSADLAASMMLPILAGAVSSVVSLGDLGAFLVSATDPVSTSITTVGNGVLTGAAMTGGVIVRSGPIANFTDTTDTAVAIIAALPGDALPGTSWFMVIKNITAFAQTLAAGVGVTLSGNKDVIPPNGVGFYLVSYTAAGAVTVQGLFVGSLTSGLPETATALTTVGAGTITAVGIAGQVTTRGGAQSGSAFTDTTDTADLIIASLPNARVGQSFEWTYRNNTDAQATLAGGVGVTVSGITIVPKNTWATFLVTYTAASTLTVVGLKSGQNIVLPLAKITTGTGATFAAGDISGAYWVDYLNNASNATLTTRTAAQMFGDIPNCQIGHSYKLAIRNLNATGATLTAADGSVTLSGTMSIAQNVTRTFEVVFTSATAVTITSMGISAAAA